MKSILESTTVRVNLHVQRNSRNGDIFFDIGAFDGNDLQPDGNSVITHQIINVSESIKQDMACRNLGNIIWHEIAESYEGGLLAISTGKSAKRALKGNYNPIYEKAHYNAGKYFPGTIRIETINDYYNGLSDEVKQFISLPFIQLYGHNRIERYTRK